VNEKTDEKITTGLRCSSVGKHWPSMKRPWALSPAQQIEQNRIKKANNQAKRVTKGKVSLSTPFFSIPSFITHGQPFTSSGFISSVTQCDTHILVLPYLGNIYHDPDTV
jgi:hypothetical protein